MRKEITSAACLLALLFAFAGAFHAPARAQSGEPEVVPVYDESFILYQNERGETVCRVATPQERERIHEGGDTRVIYRGAPMRRAHTDGGDEYLTANAAEDSTGLPLLPSAGLTIVLQGTAQLDANPTAKNAFIAAANRWEAVISTPVTITLSVDFGTQYFGEAYPSSTILGQTGSFSIAPSLSSVRSRLINTSNPTPSELELYNALPTASVPAEFNGSTVQVSTVRVNTSQARALGYTFNEPPPYDARIGFNSNFGSGGNTGQFDFDPSDGIAPGFTDFDSVVVHEIGHALGFTSSSGGTDSSRLSIWDLFRFRPSAANLGNFTTTPRVMTKGGVQVQFGNYTSTFAGAELGLSTGGPNPPEGDTDDGRQSSHWKADELTPSRPYIGIMDPTISRGLRRTISENDIRTIDLIGYSVAFNPVRPANDNFAAATALNGAAGSVNGTSAWATREPGELVAQGSLQAGFVGDKSVWFTWTAPATGAATFDTTGSGYDTTLGIYTGGAVNALATACTPCQSDDATGLNNGASRVQFNAVAGTVYRINVDGWNGEHGPVQLNWTSTGTQPTPTPTPTPAPTPTPTSGPTPGPTPGVFSVVGRVTDANGNGVGGVRVGLNGPALPNGLQYQVSVSDAAGNYVVPNLSAGTFYTVGPIRDGLYAFSPGTVNVQSSGPNIGADFRARPGNPIDGTAKFVEQHYQDFLGRASDPSGLAFWTGDIEGCQGNLSCREVKRINVSAAFFLSIEFQETGYLGYRMHQVAFGDSTDAPTGLKVPAIRRADLLLDAALISEGVVVGVGDWRARLDANKVAYAQAFVQRQRFTDIYGALGAAQFVDRLNQNAGGVLTEQEKGSLVVELTTAPHGITAARASVLKFVAEHPGVDLREKNRAFVLMQYFGYLRRNPNDAPEAGLNYAGWNFWLGKLNEFGGNYVTAEMVKAFLDSAEYRQRFAQ